MHLLALPCFGARRRVSPAGGRAPAPRDSHAAVAWGGRVLVLGGDDSESYRNDVWSFDPATSAWTEIKVGACPSAGAALPPAPGPKETQVSAP